jgi:tRNA U34 5-carboxymethylaminomethyl modifying enzyme MnmG/GidA
VRKTLLIVGVLGLASLPAARSTHPPLAAQSPQAFVGVITDDMCAKDGHEAMRMGPNDAECTKACIEAHGAEYVLAAGKDVYTLSDQKTPATFAGQRVRVTGILNARTRSIQVQSMSAAK